ncbi:MAG: hypothetical protein QOF40_2031, partial [Actinomycetota bacterium]|nr:hypothetical protein [Actinomycetota bacterium]
RVVEVRDEFLREMAVGTFELRSDGR